VRCSSGLRALLGLLLPHPNEVVATEWLIDALWHGDPPATARAIPSSCGAVVRRC
jgi:DNA-binding SARP family transcriptional activator